MKDVQNLKIKKRNDVIQYKREAYLSVFCYKSLFYIINEIIKKYKNFIPNQYLPKNICTMESRGEKETFFLNTAPRIVHHFEKL